MSASQFSFYWALPAGYGAGSRCGELAERLATNGGVAVEGVFCLAQRTKGQRWRDADRIAHFTLPHRPELEREQDANEALLAARAAIRSIASEMPPGTDLLQLQRLRILGDRACGASADFRYLLGCHATQENEPALNQWYEVEHLPKLAGVKGVLCASRSLSVTDRKRWFAQYDLIAPDVLDSDEWQQWRRTDLARKCIPMMLDVERSMMRRVSADEVL